MAEHDVQDQEALAAQWEAQLQAEQEAAKSSAPMEEASPASASPEGQGRKPATPSVDAQPASFQPVQDSGLEGTPRNLEFLLDIPLEVSVRLGTARMPIRDLLQLTHGSVVELDKLAGEPLDVLINHRLIGRGEVVVVNDRFGIRLTEVLSPAERIQRLQHE